MIRVIKCNGLVLNQTNHINKSAKIQFNKSFTSYCLTILYTIFCHTLYINIEAYRLLAGLKFKKPN